MLKHMYISSNQRVNLGVWIEGVGNLFNPILVLDYYIGLEHYYSLLCFTENDSLKYMSEEYSTCFKTGVFVSDGPDEDVIDAHVVQTSNFISFELDGMIPKTISLRIVDLSGRLFANLKSSKANNIQYDISSFPPGIYIYRLSTLEGFHCGKFVISR